MIDVSAALDGLLKNQLASGGLLLMVVGALGALARKVPAQVGSFFWRHAMTDVEIVDSDPSFRWMERWLDQHEYAKTNKSITLSTYWVGNDPKLVWTPAPGLHLLRHEGKLLWLFKGREKREVTSSDARPYSETIRVRAVGDARELVRHIVTQAYETVQEATRPALEVSVMTAGGYWSGQERPLKSADSLVLAGDQFEQIMADATTFFDSRDWYNAMGIPWRRGYLLHGPAGNGKSSLILTLGSALGCPVYVVNLAEPGLTDSRLLEAMGNIRPRALVIFEEIDTIFEQREKVGDKGVMGDYISFGGLLNALDGITAREGRITIMTTNFPEKLDAALKRPGRMDLHVHVDNATREQAEIMFLRFFPGQVEAARAFVSQLPERTISMARLQEHLMCCRNDPGAAVARASAMLEHRAPEPAAQFARQALPSVPAVV